MAQKKDNQANIHTLDGKAKDSKKPKRNRLFTIGSTVILVLIIVTFIGAPAISGMVSSPRMIFGYWGKTPIELRGDNFFGQRLDVIANNTPASNVQTDDPWLREYAEYYRATQIYRQAFEETVINTAFLSMADDADYHATEDRVNKELLAGSYYRSPVDGQFDEQRYRNTSNTVKKANFDLAAAGLQQMAVTEELLNIQEPISRGERDFINAMASDEKKIRYVAFSFSEYPAEKVVEFARENPGLFDKIDVSRIAIFDSEELVLDLHSQLEANGLLFDELARTSSQDNFASRGGAMGIYTYNELRYYFDNPADLDVIMALEEGRISDIVVNNDGWYIYRVNKAAEAPRMDDPQDIDDIRGYMVEHEKGAMEDYLVDRGLEFASAAENLGGNIAEAARRAGLSYHETAFFPVIYGNISFAMQGTNYALLGGIQVPDGDQNLQYASTDRLFLSAVAKLTPEAPVSAPLILDGGVVVIQLLEERKAPEESLAYISSRYNYAVGTWKEGLLVNSILTSDMLKDDFDGTFRKYMGTPSSVPQ